MAYTRAQAPYVVGQKTPYKISRSKIDLFLECPRCFWLGERLKIKRPDTPPFQLNKAVDKLFKAEFDYYRAKKKQHPIMVDNKIDAIPFQHKLLDTWRHNFSGVQYVHEPTHLTIFGAVDDIWVRPSGELIVVDYKATSKKSEVSLDADWQISYKRQIEVYQWLLRGNGFKVSDMGYFVYANADASLDMFENTLHFTTKLIVYEGSDSWIDPTLISIKNCLESDIPKPGNGYMGNGCEYCAYAQKRTELTLEALGKKLR